MKSGHLLYLSLLPLAVTVSGMALQPRQDVQAEAVEKCPGGIDFSCQKSTTCMPTTADNTTVICCPQGSNCTIINQIPCDITQQNEQDYPNNMVHTSDFSATLPSCGSQCCPVGYNCAGNLCVAQPQSKSPSSPATTVIPPVATSAGSTASAPTSSGTVSPVDGEVQAASHSNTKTIAIAVPVALLGAALIGLAILFFLKRRRQRQQSGSYVSNKHLRHMSSHSTNFMGSTPRPLSLPQQYCAPLTSPPAHNRSVSEPKAGPQVKSGASIVSEPMWDPQMSGGAPLARTDFLLRRGECETGYEDKIKPSWSTRRKSRPKSLRCLTQGFNSSSTKPTKTSAKSPLTPSRLVPLFKTPLRFGLPNSPSPGKNTLVVPGARLPRSDENLARVVKLEGKSVASGEAKRISNATPSPKKAKKMRMRDRSESARRPLVENIEGASREPSADGRAGLQRQSSDASATTIESDISSRSDGERGRHGPTDSSETINVMLPPPTMFHTPPPTGARTPNGKEMEEVKRDTTFEGMMAQAGWRKSEWLRK